MTFFASVFNMDYGSRGSQYPELEDYVRKDDQIPVNPEIVHDLPLQLDPYRSMGPDGIHPRTLKEMADVITKPLLMIFEPSWESGDVPADWKLINIVPIFRKGKKEDPGSNRPVSLTSVSGKSMEKIILGVTKKNLKDNAVIGHSHYGFVRGKSCLSNLFPFYDKVTHLGDQGKSVDVIFLDFSKAFKIVFSQDLSGQNVQFTAG
ncbi:hypothetical protein HGM15179_000637 [Zosterops borbonicus]|uniref:Reverse transcriptase n=1 Tax=Zosterops borbonicus TaxID=364589 RepID=A0A8K1LTP1_9PASS|nr:hypothetical protein HGM15179_000637 [Zosterops borbonicus]